MSEKLSKVVLPIKNESTGVITDKEFDVGGGGNTFVGTTAEWNALTTEQQNAYNCRVLTDDELPTVDVIDNLNSDSSTDALSAKQGKVLKGLVDTTQGQVSDSGDAYSSSKAYAVGDLCIYNNVLYRCITDCSAGSWATNQSCFTADTLANVANMLSNNVKTKVTDVFHSGKWQSFFDFYMPDNVYGLYLISSNYDDYSEMLLLQHYGDNTLITARVSGSYLNVTRSGANVGRINTTLASGLIRGVSVIKLV